VFKGDIPSGVKKTDEFCPLNNRRTDNFRHFAFAFGAKVPKVGTGFEPEATNSIRCPLLASSFWLRASSFELLASSFGLQAASGFGLRASGFGLRASGFGLRTRFHQRQEVVELDFATYRKTKHAAAGQALKGSASTGIV
jgi:hypothetical protein